MRELRVRSRKSSRCVVGSDGHICVRRFHFYFVDREDDILAPLLPDASADNSDHLVCDFRDHDNNTVTGADLAIPWCEWRIEFETLQLVLSLPDEAEGLTGGFVWPELTQAWLHRD